MSILRNKGDIKNNTTVGSDKNEIQDIQEDNKYDIVGVYYIFENNVYKYGSNSISAPDFEDAGIELKVTPYKKNKDNSLSAKERLVLNIINYMEEYKNTFFDTLLASQRQN